ncbi:MAG: 50S ribosomal protein L11 methylase [Acidobacteria bacterium OLB17]|nr:MAG: 50S ribosomal protein L11 methylase [Acidobacteria bacterium OLB17]MCZ2391304.1 50S ribosomal protein L11 methyltransferase [Acidobacteriota bacterium]
MSQDSWFAVDITVPFEAVAAAEAVFDLLEADGVETDLLRKKTGDLVKVTGIFPARPDADSVNEATAEIFAIYEQPAPAEIVFREVFPEDWLAEWKRHWKPTEIGRFVVAPPWVSVEDADKAVIRIEPKMAFGTGTHETTRLCLKVIDEDGVRGAGFLDVGTGTGILSIAVAKIADETCQIFGFDTDVDSITAARENAEQNGVAGRVEFAVGELKKDASKYGTVCANVTLDVILPLLDTLIERTGERLILSGILKTQESEISAALAERGHSSPRVLTDGEWIAVVIDL